jgi:hypothetical protein
VTLEITARPISALLRRIDRVLAATGVTHRSANFTATRQRQTGGVDIKNMSVGLPCVATCKLIGHSWMPRTTYSSEGEAVPGLGSCTRCGAPNEPATNAIYQPRHLRVRE